MDFLPPDAHHRIVFFRSGAPTPVKAVAEELTRLLDAAREWGMPYQLFAAYDAAFNVVAIDREETLLEVLEASAVDWLGERPAGAATHRFGAFNRREDPEFADIYLCFRAEGDPADPGSPGSPPRDVIFYGEVRFGVGSATGPAELRRRFEDVLSIFRPAHAFVETAYQQPRAVPEATAPRVGWGTFVPERLGPPPAFAAPTTVSPVPGGAVVLTTPDAFDDDGERAAVREHVAWDLLPFLEARVQAQPYVEPRPAEPKLAVPLFMQAQRDRVPPPDTAPHRSAQPVTEPPAAPPRSAPPRSAQPTTEPPAAPPASAQPAIEPQSAPRHAGPVPRIDAGNVPCFIAGAGADPRQAPIRAAAIVWSMAGACYVTGIAKVSFVLQSGRLALTSPEPVLEKDRFYRRSTIQSLEDHSDMIPYLPRGEALLRGTAVLPRGQTARARFLVQEPTTQSVLLDKIIDIRGDLDPATSDLVPVPLRYELAAHDETANPPGIRPGAPGGPPRIRGPQGAEVAIGLGSVSPYWPVRANRMKPHESQAFHRSPVDLPPDFGWDAYSAAPPDQRIQGFFRGTERVYLEGFHARSPVIDAALPGVLATGQAYFRNGQSTPVPMVADTIRVDLDRRVLSVTFRGYVPAPSPEPGDVVFGAALVSPGAPPPTWPEQVVFNSPVEAAPSNRPGEQTSMFASLSSMRDGLPFVPGDGDPDGRKGR